MKSAGLPACQILTDHQRHLENDGMVKLTQVKAGQLLDLFQTVNQSIAVDKQLPGGFGNIQIVLKKLIDGEKCLLIQRIDGVLLEDFTEENLAQSGGQLVDQPADTQIS